MSSMEQKLNKLREDRLAREKARIEKLRELNLKKYNKPEQITAPWGSSSSVSINKPSNIPKAVKNNFHVNSERPITAPVRNTTKTLPNKELKVNLVPKTAANNSEADTNVANNDKIDKLVHETKKVEYKNKIKEVKITANNDKAKKIYKALSVNNFRATDKIIAKVNDKNKKPSDNKIVANKSSKFQEKEKKDLKEFRKSFVPNLMPVIKPLTTTRKSIQPPKLTQSATKVNPNRQSVFERLYQSKSVHKKLTDDIQGTKNEPNLKKVGYKEKLIVNKRHSVFEPKKKIEPPVRRSISAVHFKRVSKSELNNYNHKWSSIGDKLDKAHLNDINEDDSVKGDNVVSAIKSERKRVKFQTTVPTNFNTPKSDEMQERLQNWLKKRGKSLDSYHHLQCFGIHMAQKEIKPLNLPTPLNDEGENSVPEQFDEENKENLPLDSDSDDNSYTENMNDRKNDFLDDVGKSKWRRASCTTDSMDLNDSQNTTLTQLDIMTPLNKMHLVDELLLGALNDLTELLREGFDWEQSSRWLRALRERFPLAQEKAGYWECRAALEERRGDLTASVQCWEEAIAKGTERSVVEANLDQLLDKFMQLKISPNSGKSKPLDSKLVDIKNVFKSTLIRFAVQQAKLRQSSQSPKFTVTPVRRSGRLSTHWSEMKMKDKRTPLRVCTSVRQASLLGHPVEFVPNDKLNGTP